MTLVAVVRSWVSPAPFFSKLLLVSVFNVVFSFLIYGGKMLPQQYIFACNQIKNHLNQDLA